MVRGGGRCQNPARSPQPARSACRPVLGATLTGDSARTRAATPGCRPTTGDPPVGCTRPEPPPACVGTSAMWTRSSMDPSALDGYLSEICQQCWFALLASMQLRDLLQVGAERASRLDRPDASRVWHLQCWQAVRAILSSGAALSRLLWPDGGSSGSLARGAVLGCTLGVDDHSAFREPGMRYGAPDFDDAFHRWLAAHPDPDLSFGVARAGGSGQPAPVAARWMDPDTWVVRMFGIEIDLSS